MISAERAIKTLRRDLTISSLLKGALFLGLILVPTVGPWLGMGVSMGGVLVVLGVAWMAISFLSARGSYMAADSRVTDCIGPV